MKHQRWHVNVASPELGFLSLVLAGVAYILIFILFRPLGPGLAILSIIPTILAAWLYGWRGGLLVGLLLIPISVVLILPSIRDWNGWQLMEQIGLIAGFMPVIVIGVVVGRLRDINRALHRRFVEHSQLADALRESEARYRSLFEQSPVSIWEEDASALKNYIDGLRASGVNGFRAYLTEHPEVVRHCASLVKVVRVNQATLKMFRAPSHDAFLTGIGAFLDDAGYIEFRELLLSLIEGHTSYEAEVVQYTTEGKPIVCILRGTLVQGDKATWGKVIISLVDITPRKQAEEALKASEELFRAFIAQSSEGIILLDEEGRVIEWNPWTESFTHMPRAEVIGQYFWDVQDRLSPPELRSKRTVGAHREIIHEALQTGESRIFSQPIEARWCDNLGKEWLVQQVIFPIKTSKGFRAGSITRDITERKRAEEAVRRSEEKLRRLVELATDGIVITDEQGLITEWNHSLEKITGLSRAEAIGQPALSIQERFLINPERSKKDWDAYRAQLQELLRSGRAPWQTFMEATIRHTDGTERILQQSWFSIPTDSGYILACLIQDITERSHAEAELREARHLYETVFRLNPELIVVTTEAEGRYVAVNDAQERVSGFRADEILDRTVADFGMYFNLSQRQEMLRVLSERGYIRNIEVEFRRKSGELFPALFSAARVNLGGKPCIISVVNDISERKQAEQREFELALERERTQMLTRFVRDASHEFRTPLSVISTSAYLISRLSTPQERFAEVERIERESERINHLVDMLMTMVQLESSDALEVTPLNLRSLLPILGQRLKDKYGEQPALHIDLPPSLPGILADQQYIMDAFTELLDNAYRFTPRDGSISISAGAAEKRVWVEVADTGPGIAADDLPNIFKTFWRKDTAHSTPGFGLGLPIARRIIERHGGTITVESQVGTSQIRSGTRFRVALPQAGT